MLKPPTHPIMVRVTTRLRRRLNAKRREGRTLQNFVVAAIERALDRDDVKRTRSNQGGTR